MTNAEPRCRASTSRPETLETLILIRHRYPNAKLCLCTNGLNLPDSLEGLKAIRIQHLSVTINGLDPAIVARIQSWVWKHGQRFAGEAGGGASVASESTGRGQGGCSNRDRREGEYGGDP